MTSTSESGSLASRRFVLRKLHSLTGVVPVGAFLVTHLASTSVALSGQEAFERSFRDERASPYRLVVEIVFVLLPLAFHAGYGVLLSIGPRYNVGPHPYSRNWMYAAQRVTGIMALAFIVWHVSELWLPRVAGDLPEEAYYPTLCKSLATTQGGVPTIALLYILGIAASVFHFANGLWGFCVSWGITVSRRSQRVSATVFGIAGLALFMLGANTAIYFATGARVAVLGVPAQSRTAQVTRTCADPPAARPAPVTLPARTP